MMHFRPKFIIAALPLFIAGCNQDKEAEVASASTPSEQADAAAGNSQTPPVNNLVGPRDTGATPPTPVQINHQPTFEKIIGNQGMSLQWISFYGAERGVLTAEMKDGFIHLRGKQKKEGQSGLLEINGSVLEVNEDSFTFTGTIAITGTPDVARSCFKHGMSKFEITQNRKYFRLREFEWCDGLTDYVDVYF